MGNLNLILFISIAAPLFMMLLICKDRTRTLIGFLLIGVTVCLFCGEWDGMLLNISGFPKRYFTCNITPFFEELYKALPIFVFAFVGKPKKQQLLECAIAVGVGFAILENAFILAENVSTVSIPLALIRGFGAGMMHGICTLAVGYGMSFVHTKRKLFFTGTAAFLTTAVIYHSLYNQLVQSDYSLIGFLLPTLTFIPVVISLKKNKLL